MVASFIPQNCSNQRKSVCPAVWANGRFKVGSRGPGACPINITSLTTAPPDTGADLIRGQRRQRTNRATCRPKASCFADAGIRSEEHTSELQSRFELVCRLLLEKK